MTPPTVLFEGKFLRILKSGRWEYAQRRNVTRIAFIGAVTPEEKIILLEEFRIPLNAWIVGCPAGLVGDHDGEEAEPLEVGVDRELQEEAGYTAGRIRLMSKGPTSPGLTDECISLVLCDQLKKVGKGGGLEGEQIVLHEIPLAEADAWLKQKEREGRLIDPKVYAVLYFIHCRK